MSDEIRVTGSRANSLRLTSDSGALTYQGSLVEGGGYDLATQTGWVDFRVPEGESARYSIGTVRVRLESNLPFPLDEHKPGERISLAVGGALAEVKIITFNGDITVIEVP